MMQKSLKKWAKKSLKKCAQKVWKNGRKKSEKWATKIWKNSEKSDEEKNALQPKSVQQRKKKSSGTHQFNFYRTRCVSVQHIRLIVG